MKVALELVGGGAKGIITCGVLKYLVAKNVQYDAVFATSSGSLNAAILAMGDIELLEHLWLNLRNKDVRSFAPWKLLTKEACVYDSTPLFTTLLKYLDISKIRANTKMHIITLTDYVEMKPFHILLNGEHDVHNVASYLVASCSIPLCFAPVRNRFYDGGIMDNYNAGHALDLDFERSIIVHPAVPGARSVKGFSEALDILTTLPGWGNYLAIKARFTPDRLVEIMPGKDAPKLKILDFDYKGYERKDLIKYGYDMAQRTFENE